MAVLPLQTTELKTQEFDDDGKSGRRSLKRPFHVYTDSDLDDCIVALTAPGIPLKWDVHPRDAGMRVIRRRPKRLQRRQYLIEIEYSSDYEPERRDDENPLDQRGTVNYDTAEQDKPLEETIDEPALPIVTKTFEKFASPITVKKYPVIISITQNYSTSGRDRIPPFCGSINRATFLGLPELCVKFTKFRASAQRHATYGLYWQRNYVFEYIPIAEYPDYDVATDNSPHDARPLHKGYYAINPAGTAIVANLDRSGQNVERLLDADGFELAVLAGEAPVYLHFRVNRREIWEPGLEIDIDRLDY